MEHFQAFVVDGQTSTFSAGIRELTFGDLPPGEVTIRVRYSSVNYKDSIVSLPNSRLVQRYPMVPGVDLAGEVIHSEDARFHEGDEVIVTRIQTSWFCLRTNHS